MRDWLLPLAAGFSTGILSAWGVGGGTLLLLIMTLFLGVDHTTAQGINLLYFLPTAGVSLFFHGGGCGNSAPSLRRLSPLHRRDDIAADEEKRVSSSRGNRSLFFQLGCVRTSAPLSGTSVMTASAPMDCR